MAEKPDTTPEVRAKRRLKNFNGLMWHIATFIVANGFLWFLDLLPGDGADWAYWVTICWGIGLAFHVAAYVIGEDDSSNPRFDRFVEEERQRHHIM
ncbi:MAG: 2TM domain-containing protein [Acidimicrobiia bacterium]|nr:2TM domain-containing protein [Acidimicrobiia bacterium]